MATSTRRPPSLAIGSAHPSPAALSLGRDGPGHFDDRFAAPRSSVRIALSSKSPVKGKGRALQLEGGVRVRVREARTESHDRGEPAPIARAPTTSGTTAPYDEGCHCCCSEDEDDLPDGSTASCGLSRDFDDDEDAYLSDESSLESDPSSVPSSLPALSPSRRPLFDDEGSSPEDEDDDDASAASSGSFPATPRFSLSPVSPWQSCKTFPTATDPLLSPLEDDAFLRVPDVLLRAEAHASSARPAQARLDRRADDSGVRSPSSTFATTRAVFFATASAPPPPSAPTSLLTKSLRSLIQLPNLNLSLSALPPLLSLPRLRPAPIGYDVEELGGMDDSLWGWHACRPGATDAWRDERERAAIEPSTSRRKLARRASIEGAGDFLGSSSWANDGPREAFFDFEASTTVVQLQTFSPPPSPSRKRTIALPTHPPAPPTPPPSAPPPPAPRLISNQRHLLMLSLELSMIHSGKINCPLRQRSVVLRSASRRDVESSLRHEVQPRRAMSRQ